MSEASVEAAVLKVRSVIQLGLSSNELHTRYTAIDPILSALGWDTGDPLQIRVEYPSRAGGRIDYALFNRQGQVVILIEAKDLRRNSRLYGQQLTGYVGNFHAKGESPGVGVLTDGRGWNLYDLKRSGTLENNRSKSIDVCEGDSEEIARCLFQELGKQHWW